MFMMFYLISIVHCFSDIKDPVPRISFVLDRLERRIPNSSPGTRNPKPETRNLA